MKRIFITGMLGVGKSTVIAELLLQGYKAVALDVPAWSEYDVHKNWLWREDRVEKLLTGKGSDLLSISGCAENQVKFYRHIDLIILLSAPSPLIIHRLQTRTTNNYGKKPEELEETLGYKGTVEPMLRRRAHLEIDTSAPLARVVEEVLNAAGGIL